MKSLEALALTAYAHSISTDVWPHIGEDIEPALQYINERSHWWDGEPITAQERDNILAGAVFANLGKVVIRRITRTEKISDGPHNPFLDETRALIDEISPYGPQEPLDKNAYRIVDTLPDEGHGDYQADKTLSPSDQLLGAYHDVLDSSYGSDEEFMDKMMIVRGVYLQRPLVEQQVYDIDELLGAVERVDTEAIAPTSVRFDAELNVQQEVHSISDVVERSNASKRMEPQPYYRQLNLKRNGVSILNDAHEDLRLLKEKLDEV